MGGGGGSGGPYFNVRPDELRDKVRSASDELARAFAPELQQFLNNNLAAYNGRNSELIARRQEELKEHLRDTLETAWDFRFGGSVAKHTYVDGLSDVDSLLIMRNRSAADSSPAEVKSAVASAIESAQPGVRVDVGRMAVTLTYADGMTLQLVPAVRDENKFRVPSWTRDGWSRIDPQAFASALTKRNEACEGKLVPTIKLAKAVIATWPEAVRLSGYHVESLAIDAFRSYSGEMTTASMLPYFFEQASTAVLSPIRDRSGQSVHVDTDLGRTKSQMRQKAAHWCSQIAKRMKNATTQQSMQQWKELFE